MPAPLRLLIVVFCVALAMGQPAALVGAGEFDAGEVASARALTVELSLPDEAVKADTWVPIRVRVQPPTGVDGLEIHSNGHGAVLRWNDERVDPGDPTRGIPARVPVDDTADSKPVELTAEVLVVGDQALSTTQSVTLSVFDGLISRQQVRLSLDGPTPAGEYLLRAGGEPADLPSLDWAKLGRPPEISVREAATHPDLLRQWLPSLPARLRFSSQVVVAASSSCPEHQGPSGAPVRSDCAVYQGLQRLDGSRLVPYEPSSVGDEAAIEAFEVRDRGALRPVASTVVLTSYRVDGHRQIPCDTAVVPTDLQGRFDASIVRCPEADSRVRIDAFLSYPVSGASTQSPLVVAAPVSGSRFVRATWSHRDPGRLRTLLAADSASVTHRGGLFLREDVGTVVDVTNRPEWRSEVIEERFADPSSGEIMSVPVFNLIDTAATRLGGGAGWDGHSALPLLELASLRFGSDTATETVRSPLGLAGVVHAYANAVAAHSRYAAEMSDDRAMEQLFDRAALPRSLQVRFDQDRHVAGSSVAEATINLASPATLQLSDSLGSQFFSDEAEYYIGPMTLLHEVGHHLLGSAHGVFAVGGGYPWTGGGHGRPEEDLFTAFNEGVPTGMAAYLFNGCRRGDDRLRATSGVTNPFDQSLVGGSSLESRLHVHGLLQRHFGVDPSDPRAATRLAHLSALADNAARANGTEPNRSYRSGLGPNALATNRFDGVHQFTGSVGGVAGQPLQVYGHGLVSSYSEDRFAWLTCDVLDARGSMAYAAQWDQRPATGPRIQVLYATNYMDRIWQLLATDTPSAGSSLPAADVGGLALYARPVRDYEGLQLSISDVLHAAAWTCLDLGGLGEPPVVDLCRGLDPSEVGADRYRQAYLSVHTSPFRPGRFLRTVEDICACTIASDLIRANYMEDPVSAKS